MCARPRPGLLLAALLLFLSQMGASSCRSKPFSVTISSPSHGEFTTASSVTATGSVVIADPADLRLFVNGSQVVPAADGTWSASIALNPLKVFNPITLTARNLATGILLTKRVVVIAGPSVADGDFSLDSVALRLNDTGLDSVEPLVTSLVNLDIASLLPPGTVVISDFCAIDGGFFGCLGRVDVAIVNPPPSFSGFGLDVDSMTGFAAGDVLVDNLLVDTQIIGSGLAPSCGLRLTASQLTITGDYDLQPDALDPTLIDVNLMGAPGIVFTGFNRQFTSGLCDFPLIGSLVQLIIGDVEPIVTSGLAGFLADPDGSGPADAPIADGIETALAGIQIAGPIGQGLGVLLEAPLFTVDEDVDGITLGSDGRITADFGTGLGQCTPPPDAPDLLASLDVSEPFPSFGAVTPGGGLPYGLGICISTSAFNQLLKAQIECGLLRMDLTEIDLFGTGTPAPVTAGLLTLLIPELGDTDPTLPLVLQIRPTLAPVLTGNPGLQGELAELRVGGLNVSVYEPVQGTTVVSAQVDFRAGLEFAFDDLTGALVPTLSPVLAGDIDVGITENPIHTNPGTLSFLLEALLPAVLPSVGDTLGAFPLPDFLGLSLQSVAVERNGEFVSLFVDLVPGP